MEAYVFMREDMWICIMWSKCYLVEVCLIMWVGRNVIMWEDMLSRGANVMLWSKYYHMKVYVIMWENMLSSGAIVIMRSKCYHVARNVTMRNQLLSSGQFVP